MSLNQCNNNKLSTNMPLLFLIYDTTLLINLCLFLPCPPFLLRGSTQSCPAVPVASSRSVRCPRLPRRPTPALALARHPTLRSACRGRPCQRGAKPVRAARGQTPARAQTRLSFTTAGCSTATSPWRPGNRMQKFKKG